MSLRLGVKYKNGVLCYVTPSEFNHYTLCFSIIMSSLRNFPFNLMTLPQTRLSKMLTGENLLKKNRRIRVG